MILPTKHIPPQKCLLGVGAVLLEHLAEPRSVSQLWEETRREPSIRSYERFVLALDLLYLLGALRVTRGQLRRTE